MHAAVISGTEEHGTPGELFWNDGFRQGHGSECSEASVPDVGL